MRRFATLSRTQTGTRRWASTRAEMSDDALLADIHGHLGDAGRVNIREKTITTAAGDLPLPPILNPAWIRGRRRMAKETPGPVNGRFQGKLRLNPYAIALASPIRNCVATGAYLPQFFLQDMEVVRHPETCQLWYAPGSKAIANVEPRYTSDDTADAPISEDESEAQGRDGNMTDDMYKDPDGRVRSYILGRKDVFDPLNEKKGLSATLLGARSGTLTASHSLRQANWKKGTGDLFLDIMRRTATDTLITRASRNRENQESNFLKAVPNWADIGGVASRESVLWLPEEQSRPAGGSVVGSEYATLDIENAKYNRKMAVFNLHTLLGKLQVAKLKESAPEIFGQHELVVLKRFPSRSMINLHLLLWRLQGYLRRTPE